MSAARPRPVRRPSDESGREPSATAARHGGRTAVTHGEAELTYRELDVASARVAGMLRSRGLRPGDRVGVMLGNVPQFAMAYYGVLRMGGVVVP